MTRLRTVARLFVLLSVSVVCRAGGPQVIGNQVLGTEGRPILWDQQYMPILYVTDGGTLGPLTNLQANQRVQQAFDSWASVSTASISFQNIGSMSGVPNGDVRTAHDFNQVISDCQNGLETAVVYDSDGSLFLDLYSDPSVIGFAGICAVSTDGYILSAVAALNGSYANLGQEFDAAMMHEFGHIIGLDHSQIECLNTCSTDDLAATPTMYPILLGPEQSLLAPDDVAWVSTLYPGPAFTTSYGHVSGTIFFSDGETPVQGANIVFRDVNHPRANVFSVVSGYRFTGNPGQSYTSHYLPCTVGSACEGGYLDDNSSGDEFGSRNPAVIGTYDIALPPGTYTMQVESVDPGFSGGSSVGPLRTPIPLPGPSEYWQIGESSSDDVGASSHITITAGGSVTGIDVILNDTSPRFDPFDDCDYGQIGLVRDKVNSGAVR
jgi:hypothetical protein